ENMLSQLETRIFGVASRYYNVLPMSYIGGIHLMLYYFVAGGSYIVEEAFSPRSAYRFWDTVLECKADSLWVTPTIASSLMAIGLEEESMRPVVAAQVKRITVAMGPFGTEIKERMEKQFGVGVQKAFGITETFLCCHWNDAMDTPPESVGKALPGVELFIVDEDERDVKPGGEGELRIGGKWVLPEYWRQPELTEGIFDAQRRYRTGDLARVDAQGNLFITGRIKDMIKCGGLNVFPIEVERVLARLEAVKEAAVIGVPDPFYDEKIVAFVTLKDGAAFSAEEALAFCGAHLTAQKVPSQLHVRAQFPMNAVGKIDKRSLKAEFLKGAA
ncbi:MAG: fatty acid--CoA ligase family protein, partial [Rickettsiales bacterium]|nr:fatty acid--CoA ligase family protein [Rickettsiales bacterium]